MHYLPIIALTYAKTVQISVPTIVESFAGRGKMEVFDRRLDSWAETALSLAQATVTCEGLEHIDKDENYVVISNHQSSYDIFALMHVFPKRLRMVAKQEMIRIPVVGRAMEASGFVFVDRKNHRRAREAMEKAGRQVRSGTNIWIAAEGTRSPDGRLLPFKKGGFMLALDIGARILPASIIGTRDILPSGDVRVQTGQSAHIVFHEPVDPEAFGRERRDELVSHVRNIVDEALPY